jgi:thiamine pyrophosphokinase
MREEITMFARHMFNPEGFKNTIVDGKTVGFQFDFKIQYYRGVTLSIIRNIEVFVDEEEFKREDIRFSIQGETFTLEEMRTVIDYRWLFGEWATITVLKEGGLQPGKHHIKAIQTIAPSYMPMILVNPGEYDFEI